MEKSKAPRIRSVEQYKESGGNCPNDDCGSGNIDGGSVEIANCKAYQSVSCLDCETQWIDTYSLVAIDVALPRK